MRSWKFILSLSVAVFLTFPATNAWAGKRKAQPESNPAPFEYDAFPSIPNLPASESTFTRDLTRACAALPDVDEPIKESGRSVSLLDLDDRLDDLRNAAKSAGEAQAALESLTAARTAAPVEPGRPDRPVPAEDAAIRRSSDAETEAATKLSALGPEMSRLAVVCGKLRNESDIQAADLIFLRDLRETGTLSDFAQILEHVAKRAPWSSLSAAPVAALAPGGPSAALVDHAIQGLADFVVKRAKEEAIYALQENLIKTVCEDGTAKSFLEDTCAVLKALDGSLSLRAMGTALHAAATSDLERLPDVALAYLSVEDPSQLAAYTVGRLGYASYREIRKNRAPLDVFGAIHAMNEIACEKAKQCKSVMTAVRQISVFVHVGSSAEFRRLLIDSPAPVLDVVLVGWTLDAEAQLRRVAPGMQLFEFTPDDVNQLRSVAASLWTAALHFDAARKQISKITDRSADGGPSTEQQVAEVIITVAAGVEQTALAMTEANLFQKPDDVTKAIETFTSVADISAALIVRDWGGVAGETMALLAKAPQSDAMRHLLAALSLITEIANAESSGEVAVALEAAASPVGSYRTKYQRLTLSLNAFVGGGAGGEFVSSQGLAGVSGMATGVAPVGLHFSAPFGRSKKDGKKWMHGGVAIAVIDLGALTTYRFQTELADSGDANSGSTEQAPQIGVAQIFSPGAFLTLGLGRLPLVLGAGASMSPRLRRISESGVDERDATALRFMVFLAVDVTLYQFL